MIFLHCVVSSEGKVQPTKGVCHVNTYQLKVVCCLLSIFAFYPAFSKPPIEKPVLNKTTTALNHHKVNINEDEAKAI